MFFHFLNLDMVLRPRPHLSGYFGNGVVFLRFSLRSKRKRCFRTPKTQVFESGPKSELTTPANRVFVEGRKRRFLNTTMS